MKKSLIFITHKGWQHDFLKSYSNRGVDLPKLFLNIQDFKWNNRTDDKSLIKKVRVTIEEI